MAGNKPRTDTLEDKLADSSTANTPIVVDYGTYTLAKPKSYKGFAKKLASKALGVGLLGRIFDQYEVLADDKEHYKVKVYTGKWSWYNRYDETYEIDISKKTGECSVKGTYAIKAPDAVLKADKKRFDTALTKLTNSYLKKAEAPPQQQTATPAQPQTPAQQNAPEAAGSIESYLQTIPQEHRTEFSQVYATLKTEAEKIVNYIKNPKAFYEDVYLPAKQQTGQQNRTPANAAGS
jgi:hypothetical protein